MKKFLVLCVSAAMLLSTAAASLAAVTVNGDFRYDMYQDESVATGKDQSYSDTDLRLRFSGNVSDNVYATGNFKLKNVVSDGTRANGTFGTDEFYVTHKQAWGTLKAGYYEFAFTPDAQELAAGEYKVWNKADCLFEADINLGNVAEGLTANVLCQPYKQIYSTYTTDDKSATPALDYADDGAYGVAVAYNAEKWGAQVSYANFKQDMDLTAIDVHYLINEDMKVFVNAVDYSENEKGNIRYTGNTQTNGYGIDGMDPVLGFSWNKIAGTSLFGSFEYEINKRFEDTSAEYSKYIAKAVYTFSNNVGLTVIYQTVGDSKDKTQVKVQYKF